MVFIVMGVIAMGILLWGLLQWRYYYGNIVMGVIAMGILLWGYYYGGNCYGDIAKDKVNRVKLTLMRCPFTAQLRLYKVKIS